MANNFLYIPELNPVVFTEVDKAQLPKYFTKHFDSFPFEERQYFWQQAEDFKQLWQTEDIINLQFESTFDPIIVRLLDQAGQVVIELPALIGMPNIYLEGTYSFEVAMSLAGLTTGCYYIQIEAGVGENAKILISSCQYISSTPLANTLCLEYWNSKYHKDVIFETGIKFQLRVLGYFGLLEKKRKDEVYRDQNYDNTLLSSKSAKYWPVYFGMPGDELLSSPKLFGLPDEMINILDEVWSCDNVMIDGKLFGIAEGAVPEYPLLDPRYTKRGMKVDVEEGLNRNSRVFILDTDSNKRLITSVIVDAKVFGDTGNQGSSNTVPVYNIE